MAKQGMKSMRADMGGAATTLASALAIARLKLPLDLIVATPMTENMPGGGATKPGDVYVVSCILSLCARLMYAAKPSAGFGRMPILPSPSRSRS